MLLGACIVVSAAWAQKPPAWGGPFQDAVELLQAGDLPGARRHFEVLWKSNPATFELMNAIGAALDSTGHHREATEWYEKALVVNPRFLPAQNNLALNYLSLGENRRALDQLRRATDLGPSDVGAFYNLGLLCLQMGHYHEAARAFGRVHELKPAERDPLIRLAYCEFRLAEYQESVQVLMKLRAAGESDVNYYLLLGSAQALGGDLPGAVSSLQRAVEISPTHPEPYYRLALVLLEGYRDRDAQEVLSRGLKTIPDSALLLFAMGLVEQVDGQYREALEYTQKSLERDRARPEAWAAAGELYQSLGQYDQALEAYRTAIGLGAVPEEKVKYAGLLIRLQRYDEAETTLHELIKNGSNVEKAYEGLGHLYYAQKLYTQAERVLRHAVQLDPGDGDAHTLLAQALHHLGQEEESRREAALATQKRAGLRTGPLLRGVLTPVAQGADSN